MTTRRSPAPTWSCVPLAQVTSPSDGLPDPSSSLLGRAMRLVLCPHLAGVKKRRHGVPMNPGSRVRIDAATPHRERHRRQAPRAAVASSNETAQTGVVSPTSLVNLAPPRRGETDRNTDQTSTDTGSNEANRPSTERPMQDLNYELKQLCARNRDGSFATQADRERILTLVANQLREMGFVNMRSQSLKPRHVEKLVERWTAEGLSTGTVKNRMAELRWWAEKIGKTNIVAKSNDVYGIADRRYVTNVSKARDLTSGDLAKITDPYTRASLQLQAAFGLRREESLKIQPGMGGPRRHPGAQGQLDQRWQRPRDPDPHGRATPSPGRGEARRRQGQPDSGRPELHPAAAPLRVPVRPGRHPPGPWSPPSVRPGSATANSPAGPPRPPADPARESSHASRGASIARHG